MWWVVTSIPHGEPNELVLILVSDPQLVWKRPKYVLSCLRDGAYKRILLLIRGSSPCGGCSRFLLSLSEWSFTICAMSYGNKWKVLSASLNLELIKQGRKAIFYLIMHSMHFLFTAIWHRTCGIRPLKLVREETCCCHHMGKAFLYTPCHIKSFSDWSSSLSHWRFLS